MSRSDEELATLVSLYGCKLETHHVRVSCEGCGKNFWLSRGGLWDTIDKWGDVCLQYCTLCAEALA